MKVMTAVACIMLGSFPAAAEEWSADDLTQAYGICESLPGVSPFTKRFPPGYERCAEVRDRWWASPQGQAILDERRRKDDAQVPPAEPRSESETERNEKSFLRQLK